MNQTLLRFTNRSLELPQIEGSLLMSYLLRWCRQCPNASSSKRRTAWQKLSLLARRIWPLLTEVPPRKLARHESPGRLLDRVYNSAKIHLDPETTGLADRGPSGHHQPFPGSA
ncbi:hypothetical protein B0H17DRAFT_1142754 [Mycena rosella]|uniref:Uncharacterized protein n=1 Tax=Mycena rosella TaxID=1033263 RepID=A0AAD7CWN1_MYCRO|nr:hypothetical protein B0H17DRAFT_1142754 [Mycena rosella]